MDSPASKTRKEMKKEMKIPISQDYEPTEEVHNEPSSTTTTESDKQPATGTAGNPPDDPSHISILDPRAKKASVNIKITCLVLLAVLAAGIWLSKFIGLYISKATC